MTTFVTVKDILQRVRTFRQALKLFYTQLAETAGKRELQIYLAYMIRHEDNFEKVLAAHDGKAMNHKLDTWMQYGPEGVDLTLPDLNELNPEDMSVEEAECIALASENAILTYYKEAAKSVQCSDAHDLLVQLAEQQQSDILILKQASESLRQNI